MQFVRSLGGGVLAVGLILGCVCAQAQDSVAAFYRGRTISITIGFPPGGSYDSYSRFAAAHMGKYIPGRPSFVVQNKPGGIGVMRSFYETAPRGRRDHRRTISDGSGVVASRSACPGRSVDRLK